MRSYMQSTTQNINYSGPQLKQCTAENEEKYEKNGESRVGQHRILPRSLAMLRGERRTAALSTATQAKRNFARA